MPEDRAQLEQAVDHGDVEAMFELAELLIFEWNLPGNAQRAEALFRAAIQRGHVGAMGALGYWLVTSSRTNAARQEEGYQLIEQAAAAGNTRSMMFKGWQCRHAGLDQESLEWFRRPASSLGNATATAQIGRIHAYEGRPVEAEHWLTKAVEEGDSFAITALADLLRAEGRADELEQWYQLGVERGDVRSMILLGQLRESEGQLEEAERLYRASAGTLDGMGALGALLVRSGREAEGQPLLDRVEDAWRYR